MLTNPTSLLIDFLQGDNAALSIQLHIARDALNGYRADIEELAAILSAIDLPSDARRVLIRLQARDDADFEEDSLEDCAWLDNDQSGPVGLPAEDAIERARRIA